MTAVLCAEIAYYDTAPGTLYLSSRPFVTRGSDTLAHTPFMPRLTGNTGYSVQAFAGATTFGLSTVGAGVLEISNGDARLDGWLDYAFNGRALTLRIGDTLAAYPAGFTTVFAGVIDRVSIDDVVKIEFKDPQAVLLKPLQTVFFAGSNSLPNGLEGVGDLKEKPKPRVYGAVREANPPMVNSTRLIFQASDQRMTAISQVCDRGNPLGLGAAYTSQADMEANAPTPGQARVWLPTSGGAFIRLGSSPDGPVTFDGTAYNTAADRTVAQLLKRIAVDAGISGANVSTGDVTALDTANSAEAGYFLNGTEVARQVMDAVAASIGAAYWVDAAGVLRMAQLQAPAGSSVATLTRAEIQSISVEPIDDPGRGVPAWRVELDYRRYWTPQDRNVATAAGAARIADLAQPYRRVSQQDAAISAKWLNSPTLTMQTLLDDATVAQAECDRRLAQYKALRLFLTVTAKVSDAVLAALVPNAVITITYFRFGLSAGRQFRVLGVKARLLDNVVVLGCWG